MCRSASGGPYTVDDLGEARRLIDEYAELAARLAACEDPRAELLRAELLEAGRCMGAVEAAMLSVNEATRRVMEAECAYALCGYGESMWARAGARWASETMTRLYALREIELTNGWESDGHD